MKSSREDVINSAMFFAKQFGLEENYNARMTYTYFLPELIKDIVYELFVNDFNPYFDEGFENYKILHEYAIELRKNGFVEFGK